MKHTRIKQNQNQNGLTKFSVGVPY